MIGQAVWNLVHQQGDRALLTQFKTRKGIKKAFRDRGYDHILEQVLIPATVELANQYYSQGLTQTADTIQLCVQEYRSQLKKHQNTD